MAGHSHWAGIKHKKEITDKKRGQLFSKLLKAVSIAAKTEPNPQFNPRLRAAIEKARDFNVPQDNIERAIKKASDSAENLEELLMEAYGPEGIAILIIGITDNKNRTISETKTILRDYSGKWANPGSVQWAFEKIEDGWQPKFPQAISQEAAAKLESLCEALDNHDDIEDIYTSAQ